ncbi:cell division protein [Lactobacillus sp. LL6]|uniref:cell division protein n=1 Tax=Lactobacillus sp. LL6 TaxID=2596827 RepID=UPI001185542D|nr:cell division protein [Lactobacillus sp. LL6]TSO26139.1 cell division protein [Lactobacillus sp. LL6]
MKIKKVKWDKVGLSVLPYLVILLTTYVMLRYQIRAHATFITSDRFLHFSRFYDASMQIKTGNFSYFQMNYGFNECGRIFNALYGPLFAYLNGLALILCRNWYNYSLLTNIAVCLVGGIGMYQLGLKGKVNRTISLLLAILYLQFGIIIGMMRANNFMAWGAALAPYVLIQAVNMMQDKERPIHWLTLGIVMAVVAQVHLLSTVILAVTLIPFAIYSFVESDNKKQIVIDIIKAIGVAVVLTANIWGAFIYVYASNKIATPNIYSLRIHAIHTSLMGRFYQHGHIGFGFFLMMVFQFIYLLRYFKKSHLNTLATIWSLMIFVVSSKLMPWDAIQAKYANLGSSLQFPYRLVVGAIPLMLMAFGISATQIWEQKNYREVKRNFILFAILIVIFEGLGSSVAMNYSYANTYANSKRVVSMDSYYTISKNRKKFRRLTRKTNNGELFRNLSHAEPDYLPKPVSNDFYGNYVIKARKKFKHSVKGSKLTITWKSKKAKKMILPLIMYKQSQLVLNGKKVSPKLIKNGQPQILARKGQNSATLSFKVATWFWILLIITILGWIGLLVYWIILLSRKIK